MENVKVYGIDIGTTYSLICRLDANGLPVVIPNLDDSSDLLASAVYFQEGGDPVIGEAAKGMKDMEPDRVVEYVKRWIGKPDAPTYRFGGKTYNPITISALILKRIKQYADEQGENVRNVVITCPAYFGNEEKAATKQAGEIAGLNVLNIIHEPTAAALNYCTREFRESRKIMVYDLGGGTFDITLFDFSVDENGKADIGVIRTGGNDRLGGIDWDERLFSLMCDLYAEETGVDRRGMENELLALIRSNVESVKKDLSRLEKKAFLISCGGEKVRLTVTRKDFEARTRDLVAQTTDFVRQVLADSDLTAGSVDTVLLVGGSTFMPMIRSAVEALFPGKVLVEQPNLAVAKGAALSAAMEVNEILRSTIPTDGASRPRPAKPPLTSKALSDLFDRPPTAREIERLSLLPVTEKIGTVSDRLTRSLGPAAFFPDQGDRYLIENLLFVGDPVGSTVTGNYYTRYENQTTVTFVVYENISEDRGNRFVVPCFTEKGKPQSTDPALKVKRIGEVHLHIPPGTRKGAPLRAVFESSTTGLNVTAINVETGESASIEIKSDFLLDQAQMKAERAFNQGVTTSGIL